MDRINVNDMMQDIARSQGGSVKSGMGEVREIAGLTLNWLAVRFKDDPASVIQLLHERDHRTADPDGEEG